MGKKAKLKLHTLRVKFRCVHCQQSLNQHTVASQDVYKLGLDWKKGEVTSDASLNKGAFKFINQSNLGASAVLSKNINGRQRAVYISSHPNLSGQQEIMTPKLTGAIWLESTSDGSGTMISKGSGDVTEFDMTRTNTASATWDGQKFFKT